MSDSVLLQGDCLEVLKDLPDNSIDSLCCDPPAGINFMSKSWDDDKGGRKQWIVWMTQVMSECLRVLKPGAHGLVWALPRTSHWTATALEDAGFEIRDSIEHIFGSGFPKSLDISKAIDKAAGAEREQGEPKPYTNENIKNNNFDAGGGRERIQTYFELPSTSAAKQWQGFGTALKPAHETWWLVRKPCSEKTVAANVLLHGTGGINIDASRIGVETLTYRTTSYKDASTGEFSSQGQTNYTTGEKSVTGRFPANLIFSHSPGCVEVGTKKVKSKAGETESTAPKGWKNTSKLVNQFGHGDTDGTETVAAWECEEGCAVAELDRQSGDRPVSGSAKLGKPHPGTFKAGFLGTVGERSHRVSPNDSGGASRFFYCAKASKKDKGVDNTHPTVKSQALMSYLINMITPPKGIVLDPFMGSGTTGVSALKNSFAFIGIEQSAEYYTIAEKRITLAGRSDDGTVDISQDDSAA